MTLNKVQRFLNSADWLASLVAPYIDIIREFSPSCADSKGALHAHPDHGPCPRAGQISPYFRTSL